MSDKIETKIDVLWYSVSPLEKSGYGVQTSGIINELTKYDDINIDVDCLGGDLKNTKEITVNDKKVKLYKGEGGYFDPKLPERAKDYDVVVTHMDQWVIPNEWKRLDTDLIHWTIIDQTPPPKALDLIETQDNTSAFIPMTRWAKDEMLRHYKSFKTLDPIYHGIDIDKFDTDDVEIDKLYQDFVKSTDFFVGMIATNTLREMIPSNLEAFAQFAEKVDCEPKIYINCKLNKENGYYMPIVMEHILKRYDISREQIVFRSPEKEKLTDDELIYLYNKMDVLLATTMGDSFGIPICEAGACKTPSIVTDFSAPKELVGDDRGLKVEPSVDIWMQRSVSKQAIPKTEDIADALMKYYKNSELKKEHGENMYNWVNDNCDWEKIGKKWVELLRNKYG